MAYSYALPDTSTRQKILDQANAFAPDINPYFAQIQQQGNQALQQSFGAAQQNLGQQFSPMFRLAQARLGAQPYLADSGYANRLNRQLQQSALGALTNAYGQAAANQGLEQQSALERLIQARIGAQQSILNQILASGQKKKGPWGAIGAGIGAVGGALIGGPPGAAAGGSLGGSIGGAVGGGGMGDSTMGSYTPGYGTFGWMGGY